jgi:SAM-dependent methyltransferase
MIIHRIREYEELSKHQKNISDAITEHKKFLDEITPKSSQDFCVSGYSYTAKKQVDFLVDFQHSSGLGEVNWRERVCCPLTYFNNRMRATFHLFDIEMEAYDQSVIYLTEQVTPIYNYFKGKYKNTIGSEYLGDAIPFGSKNKSGIQNEDLCNLSFDNESFDILVSLDVLEHIPNHEKAFRECSRVLKPGGRMMWSVPFIPNSAKNSIRAKLTNGEIEHILPPEYHGDPLSDKGVLCFQHFGWEMLEQVRQAGFRDAYAICYFSTEFGYLGGEQFMFFAIK